MISKEILDIITALGALAAFIPAIWTLIVRIINWWSNNKAGNKNLTSSGATKPIEKYLFTLIIINLVGMSIGFSALWLSLRNAEKAEKQANEVRDQLYQRQNSDRQLADAQIDRLYKQLLRQNEGNKVVVPPIQQPDQSLLVGTVQAPAPTLVSPGHGPQAALFIPGQAPLSTGIAPSNLSHLKVSIETKPHLQFLVTGAVGDVPEGRHWWLGTFSGELLWPQLDIQAYRKEDSTQQQPPYRLAAPKGVQSGDLVLIDAGPVDNALFAQHRSDPLGEFPLVAAHLKDSRIISLPKSSGEPAR